jgi:hypothetical protein
MLLGVSEVDANLQATLTLSRVRVYEVVRGNQRFCSCSYKVRDKHSGDVLFESRRIPRPS